jgi:hypothetical protein
MPLHCGTLIRVDAFRAIPCNEDSSPMTGAKGPISSIRRTICFIGPDFEPATVAGQSRVTVRPLIAYQPTSSTGA